MTGKTAAECPDCGCRVRFTLADVVEQRTARCSREHSVKMRDERGGARKASTALGDLDQALKTFGKQRPVRPAR